MPELVTAEEIRDRVMPRAMLAAKQAVTHAQRKRIRRYAGIMATRQIESLALYEPLPHVDEFHKCFSPDRILRGSNRAGKTLGAAVEAARALTGRDPYGKFPKKHGRAFIVGKDGKHNSEVLYRKLFRANAFRIIRDKKTGQWRAFRPWTDEDSKRRGESRAAPPLIPPRMITEMSWENKKDQIPNVCRLTTGWEVRFFSSLAKPPQGSDLDFVWFDEEIVDPEWYAEVAVRGLVDRRGRFLWSATAQMGGVQLYELVQAANDIRGNENPRISEFFAHIDSNPHFTDEQRDLFVSRLTEEQRRIRIEGEFAFTSFRVFPEFSIHTHGVDFFQIPADWTRYMVVDPGRQVCAALFMAVPPPHSPEAGHVYFFDELYIRNCDAKKFGEAVAEKMGPWTCYAFLIDHHGSRITDAGSGNTIEFQYSQALKENNVSSAATGHGFIWGSDDVQAGLLAFRSWLVIGPEGQPKLRVFRDKLPNFVWEMDRYHYKRLAGKLTDQPEKRNDHLADCSRYAAMYDPKWYAVRHKPRVPSTVLNVLKRKEEKRREREGDSYLTLGPGSGGGLKLWR